MGKNGPGDEVTGKEGVYSCARSKVAWKIQRNEGIELVCKIHEFESEPS